MFSSSFAKNALRILVCLIVLSGFQIKPCFGQPITITVFPSGTTNNFNTTGSVTSTGGKSDCNMTNINSTNTRAWATFQLPFIPPGSVFNSVDINFTTFNSTSSSSNNNLYCFSGSTLALSGSVLYTNCASGTLVNTSSWVANATQTKSFNAAGLNFLNTAGSLITVGFVRGSNLPYSIYGYCSSFSPSLVITYTPPCSLPNGYSLGNTSVTTNPVCATSAFTLSVQNTTSLTGSGYNPQWQWSADNIVWNDISGATSMTYTDTWQYSSAFRYYRLKISCYSYEQYSTPIQVFKETNFIQCYCDASSLTNGCTANREYISNVKFNEINHASSCGNANQYSNYASVQTALPIGSSVMASVMVTNSFSIDNVRIWFDFNHNSSFSDAGEQFTLVRSATSGTQPFHGVITIPTTALSGDTRMRVRLTGGTPTPCGASVYGEIEDYIVNLVAAPTSLQVKTFLEGYYTGSSLMDKVLYNQGVESSTSTSNADVIEVDLHEDIPAYPLLAKSFGILKRDGTVNLQYPASVNGKSCYVVVKHRNSVATWSATPITLPGTTSYDFTTAASKAFGNNLIQMAPAVFAIYSGDLNQDMAIDAFDFLDMLPFIIQGDSGYLSADTNGDGTVDAFDFIQMEQNLIQGISVAAP